jgi:hypothetical protein
MVLARADPALIRISNRPHASTNDQRAAPRQ